MQSDTWSVGGQAPSLIVITGPPGAGKSTVAQSLAQRFEQSVLIEGDAFFGFLERGNSEPWTPEADYQNDVVIRAGGSAAAQYVNGGYTTVFEGIVGPWFLPTFAMATGLDRLNYLILMPSIARCLERIAARPAHEFKNESATIHMHQEFVRADVDARHVLVDPPLGVEALVDQILALLRSQALVYEHGLHPRSAS